MVEFVASHRVKCLLVAVRPLNIQWHLAPRASSSSASRACGFRAQAPHPVPLAAGVRLCRPSLPRSRRCCGKQFSCFHPSNVFEIITSLALHYSCRIPIPFPKQERRRLASKACPSLTLRPPSPSLHFPLLPHTPPTLPFCLPSPAPASIPTSPPAGCRIASCE